MCKLHFPHNPTLWMVVYSVTDRRHLTGGCTQSGSASSWLRNTCQPPVPHVSSAKPCFSGVGHKHNQVTVHKIQHTYMSMLGSSAHASLGSSWHIAQTANDQDKTPISSSSSLSPTQSVGLSQGAMSPRPSSASISQLMSVVTMILVSRRLHRVR